jgi:sugar/nucleoside kinase (ribokinase family)
MHHHLYAIGNALVDTEYEVTEAQLQSLGVEKHRMTLIDAPRRADLLAQVHGMHARRTGGGSAGNTVVALAQLGGHAFYSCRVADDELGAFYREDLAGNQVATNLNHGPLAHGQTGSCMVFVTPDAARSMCTFLGATAELDTDALHAKDISKAQVYYIEGYLSASPTGLAAALDGRAQAKAAGVALATTLSDVSMINFCRPGLDAIVGSGDLDYLFANLDEAEAWTGHSAAGDARALLAAMAPLARTVCITRGPLGCWVLEGGEVTAVPGVPAQAVDTNGAGDMFAGAFLYAATHGYSHAQAAELGNLTAAAVVSQHGNRLSTARLQEIKASFEAQYPRA